MSLAASDACDPSDSPIRGLNLTRGTLDGILKYPWAYGTRKNPKKWGYYSTEKQVFEWVRAGSPRKRRSVIAEIMDWSDDITFAIHDLMDFYRAGRIPIDRCKGSKSTERARLTRGMFKRKPQWLPNKAKYEEALAGIIDNFPFEPDQRYTDGEDDRATLYAFATALIKYFVGALHLNAGDGASSLISVEAGARMEVEVLKQFIWEYIIENPDLAVLQNGQRVAIQTVFGDLVEASRQKKFFLFPSVYQEAISKARRAVDRVRTVADCISGMTEKEIMHFYRCLRGHS